MTQITTIKGVECYGKLYEDCSVAVKTGNDYWMISGKDTWNKTVDYVLDDPNWNKLAKNDELELEVD
tara:strand:+ start:255 stop:455 length:201 start_codon:yes stop_codon:yes gene_type:complete